MTAAKTAPSVSDRAKELLADPARRIELDSFVNEQLAEALEALSPDRFPVTGAQPNPEEFGKRIAAYEAALASVLALIILLARWGDNEEGLLQLEKIVARIAETASEGGGTVLWLRLRWYPVWLLMYAGGIAALAARRYNAIAMVLTVATPEDSGQANSPLKAAVLQAPSRLLDVVDAFKWLPGREQNRFPLSEHLFVRLKPIFESLLFLGPAYERHFDRFEVLTALVYADLNSRAREGDMWGPPGRFVYKAEYRNNPFGAVQSEAEAAGDKWPLLASGLFQSSLTRFKEVSEGFRKSFSRWGRM
jgi:hypothetical protein